MKLSKNELLKVARVFAQRLKETGVKVKSIIVGGSVLRDDFVSGFSDIDVYVFVSHSEIDSNFFINLRGVLEDIEKEFRVNLRPDVFFVEDLPVLLNRRVGVNDLSSYVCLSFTNGRFQNLPGVVFTIRSHITSKC